MSAARFEDEAQRCERLAAIMLARAQRDAYVEMGRMWRKLANETANHLRRVAAWERRNGIGPAGAESNPAIQDLAGASVGLRG